MARTGGSDWKPEERENLERLGVDGWLKLKLIFKKWDQGEGRRGLHSSGSGYGQVAGCCEYGNEHLGSTKCENY